MTQRSSRAIVEAVAEQLGRDAAIGVQTMLDAADAGGISTGVILAQEHSDAGRVVYAIRHPRRHVEPRPKLAKG